MIGAEGDPLPWSELFFSFNKSPLSHTPHHPKPKHNKPKHTTQVGDYRQANQWLSIMSWEGVAASTVTYNCVLDACANGGNPQRAAELFQEMKDRKVRLW